VPVPVRGFRAPLESPAAGGPGLAGTTDDSTPSGADPLLTIGDLARATGRTVRTIRYWSDEGLLPPVDRFTTPPPWRAWS
jgi:hypothetical protein